VNFTRHTYFNIPELKKGASTAHPSEVHTNAILLPNPQTFHAHLVTGGGAVEVIHQAAVPPLQHAHTRLEEVVSYQFSPP